MVSRKPDTLPQLNLFAPPLLLGLCRRMLSPEAQPDQAPLTARKIEHLRVQHTEWAKRVSVLKAETGIFQEKALAAKKTLQQAVLDLQLHDEQHPAPAAKRGLLRAKPSSEQVQLKQQRDVLAALASQAEQSAREQETRAQTASRELLTAEASVAQAREGLGELQRGLRDQLGAWILELVAAGNEAEARLQLAELRRSVRGDLVVGVLLVLVELFSDGPAAAQAALLEARPIFEQHPDPAPRVLGALIKLVGQAQSAAGVVAGVPLNLQELGYFLPGQFAEAATYRLYQLVRVLSWQPADLAGLPELVCGTLQALQFFQQQQVQVEMPDELLAALLYAHTAWRQEQPEVVYGLVTDAIAAWQPSRKTPAPPSLMATLAQFVLPAWPAISTPQLRTALANHVLLAARELAPATVYDAWLAESYGWVKDDLYWWVQSVLKDDPGLLRSLKGGPGELCTVRPL